MCPYCDYEFGDSWEMVKGEDKMPTTQNKYYKAEGFKGENGIIYNEDCIKTMKKIKPESIQLVWTSPPYFNVKDYVEYDNYQQYLHFLTNVFEGVFTILEPGRMCVVNISTIIVPRPKRSKESRRIPIPFHFVNIMENIGFKFLEDIIWAKPEGQYLTEMEVFLEQETQ